MVTIPLGEKKDYGIFIFISEYFRLSLYLAGYLCTGDVHSLVLMYSKSLRHEIVLGFVVTPDM